jgi:N-acetylglucosaminyldiphosphoundecaprenol N-acetyl-beta-D-mannosaminyltransferase
MPTPRKERFLSAYRDRLSVPFIMGVGGSFDVIAGHVRRAPQMIQSMGLEWLYRVYQEPRRMWWRYARTNTLFAKILISDIAHRYRFGLRRTLSGPS